MTITTPPRGPGIDTRVHRSRRAAELSRQRRRNSATMLAVLALLAPVLIGAAVVISNVERAADLDSDVVVDIAPGSTPESVATALVSAEVISSAKTFQDIAQVAGFTTFTAGKYTFVRGGTEREALDTLRGGPAAIVADLELLLPPGLTLGEIADRVGKLPGKSRDRFLEAAASGNVRSQYQPAEVTSLEGLTMPETYAVGANESETEILQKIVDEFDRRAAAAGIDDAPAIGLTPYQAITSASLIQGEAGTNEDAPNIAAVIMNRLRVPMLLQIDATLCYAKGGCPPVPVDADRRIDSPWNTYKYAGLPPTPIETVSEVSLKAALHPAEVDYLFYVSDKDGKTYFASTQAEHDRNVARVR